MKNYQSVSCRWNKLNF